jgi:predicted transcriptional regulator
MMHNTHISWVAFNKIKEPLISQGLLAEFEDPGDKRSRTKYRATEKGEEFLEHFGLALKLIKPGEKKNI